MQQSVHTIRALVDSHYSKTKGSLAAHIHPNTTCLHLCTNTHILTLQGERALSVRHLRQTVCVCVGMCVCVWSVCTSLRNWNFNCLETEAPFFLKSLDWLKKKKKRNKKETEKRQIMGMTVQVMPPVCVCEFLGLLCVHHKDSVLLCHHVVAGTICCSLASSLLFNRLSLRSQCQHQTSRFTYRYTHLYI